MTDQQLPEPLVPPEVDLRGYEFMHFYGDRLFKSETWIGANPVEKIAMLKIWWHAFSRELPAASLPQRDQLLADYAGFGMSVSTWKKARPQVLRGFVLCSDDRLYHPFLAKLAIGAWRARLADRIRGAKARLGAMQKRLIDAKETDKPHINHLLQAQGQELSQLTEWAVTADNISLSQGQKGKERVGKERKGEGLGSNTVAASNNASTSPPVETAPAPSTPVEKPEAQAGTPCGAMSAALREEGVDVTPGNPFLLGWIKAGATVPMAREAVDRARIHKAKPERIPAKYLNPIVLEVLEESRRPPINVSPSSSAWWSTSAGIIAKAIELGIPGDDPYRLKCEIAAAMGGDTWPWIDARNDTQQRLIREARERKAA